MIPILLIPYVLLFYFLLPITYSFKVMLVFTQINALIYILYFILVTLILKQKPLPTKVLLVGSTLLFIILLLKPHSLSNDIYRYVWDGMLSLNGYNPLIYKPEDSLMQEFHNEPLYKILDWKGLYSPYPPFAQFIFVISNIPYKLFGLLGARSIFALPHLITGFFLYKFVDKRYAWIFLLNPLSLIEVVNSGHIDGYITVLLLATLILYKKARYSLSAFFLTLAILTKIYPILFLPVFVLDLIRQKKWRAFFISSLVFLCTLVVFYMPFLWGTIFPLTRYALIYEEQEYNASIFRYLNYYFLDNSKTSRIVAQTYALRGFVFSTLLLYIPRFSFKILLLIGVVYLAFSPLVFPWYLLFFYPIVFFEAQETKDNLIIYLFTYVQILLLTIYLEPGTRQLRELMLNIEYGLILAIIVFYAIYSILKAKKPHLFVKLGRHQ